MSTRTICDTCKVEVRSTAEQSLKPLIVTVRIGSGSSHQFHLCPKCAEDKGVIQKDMPKNDVGSILEDVLYEMVQEAVDNQ